MRAKNVQTEIERKSENILSCLKLNVFHETKMKKGKKNQSKVGRKNGQKVHRERERVWLPWDSIWSCCGCCSWSVWTEMSTTSSTALFTTRWLSRELDPDFVMADDVIEWKVWLRVPENRIQFAGRFESVAANWNKFDNFPNYKHCFGHLHRIQITYQSHDTPKSNLFGAF